MIALLLAVAAQMAAPATATTPLGAIGKQVMPARGCAAFLWTVNGERLMVAMAGAEAARIKVNIDGKTSELARVEESGVGGFGFGQVMTYRDGDVGVTLDMTIVTRGDLTAGAVVPQATLRIDRPRQDTIVVPVAGLIGCAT